ncbi:hypothetical protein BST81_16980 [Leptolyngbya sp. 'hensonii']|nr:hypothetical protein BST81_16980 [Leptolyngbya sp. 'hensonii']
MTQIRLQIVIPGQHLQEPIISCLIAHHGLVVNILAAQLQPQDNEKGWFDLQLRGTVSQILKGLAFLEALNLSIQGKPNPDGDSWHY